MKFSKCIICILVLALLAAVAPKASAAPQVNGCFTLQAGSALAGSEKLLDTAKAAILYELNSGTMVYSYNVDKKIDPSGMNKIMAALVALENSDPEEKVCVTRETLNTVPIGSVSAGLKRDEIISVQDLLYCMMVGSANDAAIVLAEHVGGTQEKFVSMMNIKALELGCENTFFANPTGISEEGQYTTARELAIITEKALQNELFRTIFCTAEYTVPATNQSEPRVIHTTNHLQSDATVKDQLDNRVTGGKTGAISTTDRSLICTAEMDGSYYLSVVMSAKGTVTADGLAAVTFGSFEETRKLLDLGFKQHSVFSLFDKDQVVAQAPVNGGTSMVSLRAKDMIKATLPSNVTQADLRYSTTISNFTAPVKAGQQIGNVQVWYGELCVGQTALIAMHDVSRVGEGLRELSPSAVQPKTIPWGWIIGIGAAVIVIAGVVAIGIVINRRSAEAKRKARRRRRRRTRVRSGV